MKKVLSILVVSLIFLTVACNQKANTTSPETNSEPEKKEVIIKGKYKGILPTASGMGMELTVTLSDSTFQREMLYIGKEGLHVAEGKYTFDAAESIVTLVLKVKESEPNKYLLKNDSLIRLDMDGKEITGEMAKYYILIRQ